MPAPPPPGGLTWRAALLGLGLSATMALAVPWNDWGLRNTGLYNNYLPLAVTLLLLGLQWTVNPLLGRRRLRRGEMVLIAAMLLATGGVASSGLARYWPTFVSYPAKVLAANPVSLEPLKVPVAPAAGTATDSPAAWRWAYPPGLFHAIPERGRVDGADPEFRAVVEGYLRGLPQQDTPVVCHRATVTWRDGSGTHRAMAVAGGRTYLPAGALDLDHSEAGKAMAGLSAGTTATTAAGDRLEILAVVPPSLPWDAWWPLLLRWSPLILGALIAMLALARIVTRQWMEHERLPYPIAEVTLALMAEPESGRRLPRLLRDRGFLAGLTVVFALLAWRGLYAYGVMPIELTLGLDLRATFQVYPWDQAFDPRFLYSVTLYFSLIALTFFLPLDVSFSLWFFFVLINGVAILGAVAGLPIEEERYHQATVGGYGMMAVLILFLGRSYYLRLLRAALIGWNDPILRPVVPYVWALLAGAGVMVGFLVATGATLGSSLVVVLGFLAAMLVLSRIVAEAGVPFLQTPCSPLAGLNVVTFSLVGFGLPATALIPLTLIGSTLMADTRESLMPYAVNAHYCLERGQGPRRSGALFMLLAVGLAVVLSLGAMLAIGYTRGSQLRDSWPAGQTSMSSIQPVARGLAEQETEAGAQRLAKERHHAWASYATGAGVVAGLGAGRMLCAGWPLHPLGFLVSTSYMTWQGWFSFFLGWLAKMLVMRFGGTGLYSRLKPVAIGMIAGEALAVGLFILVRIVAALCGDDGQNALRMLPG